MYRRRTDEYVSTTHMQWILYLFSSTLRHMCTVKDKKQCKAKQSQVIAPHIIKHTSPHTIYTYLYAYVCFIAHSLSSLQLLPSHQIQTFIRYSDDVISIWWSRRERKRTKRTNEYKKIRQQRHLQRSMAMIMMIKKNSNNKKKAPPSWNKKKQQHIHNPKPNY